MPDRHKEIAERVRSKREREEARQVLRKHYGDATHGTEWRWLAHDLHHEREPIDPNDPIEFYEVELRAVQSSGPPRGWATHGYGRMKTLSVPMHLDS